MDPDADPDPVILVSDLQGVKIFCLLLFEVQLHHFSKKKVVKKP